MNRYKIIDTKEIKNKKIYKAEDKLDNNLFYIVEYGSINFDDYEKDEKALTLLKGLKESNKIYDYIEYVDLENDKKEFYKVFKPESFKHKKIFNSKKKIERVEDDVKTVLGVDAFNHEDDIKTVLGVDILNYEDDVKTVLGVNAFKEDSSETVLSDDCKEKYDFKDEESLIDTKNTNIKTAKIEITAVDIEPIKESKLFNINIFIDLKSPSNVILSPNSEDELNINFFNNNIVLNKYMILLNERKEKIFFFYLKSLFIKQYNDAYQLYSLEKGGEEQLIVQNNNLKKINFLKDTIEKWIGMLPKSSLDITRIENFSIFGVKNKVLRVKDGIEIDIEKLPKNPRFKDKIKKYQLLLLLPEMLIFVFLMDLGYKNFDWGKPDMEPKYIAIMFFLVWLVIFFTNYKTKVKLTKSIFKITKIFVLFYKKEMEVDYNNIDTFSLQHKQNKNSSTYLLSIIQNGDKKIKLFEDSDRTLMDNILKIILAWNNHHTNGDEDYFDFNSDDNFESKDSFDDFGFDDNFDSKENFSKDNLSDMGIPKKISFSQNSREKIIIQKDLIDPKTLLIGLAMSIGGSITVGMGFLTQYLKPNMPSIMPFPINLIMFAGITAGIFMITLRRKIKFTIKDNFLIKKEIGIVKTSPINIANINRIEILKIEQKDKKYFLYIKEYKNSKRLITFSKDERIISFIKKEIEDSVSV